MKTFFVTLPRNIIRSFTGRNWAWHLAAIAATYALVMSNDDWNYFVAAQSNPLWPFFFPAVVIGAILPILVPLAFIIYGWAKKNTRIKTIGWAIGQAALAGWLVSTTYKIFTGRIQPNMRDLATNVSHGFQFGFFRNGIFWGWPSSHTAVAFAMALCTIKLFPKNKAVAFLCLIYSLYIGVGVTFSIHWLSDALAGLIIGSVIGIVVGNRYKNRIL
jgi:membrane-associated phospholipid phosphatase